MNINSLLISFVTITVPSILGILFMFLTKNEKNNILFIICLGNFYLYN